MTIVSVLYPKSSDSHFDHDYYLQKHIPMVQARWAEFGLQGVELMRGASSPDGAPPIYELIGLLNFGSTEQVQTALTKFRSRDPRGHSKLHQCPADDPVQSARAGQLRFVYE